MGTELVPYSETHRDAVEDGLLNKELAHRKDHGIEVFLYWHSKNNVLSLFVTDVSANRSHNFIVPNDKGLDAFYHPYAYAAGRGLLETERGYEGEDGS